MEEDYRLIWMRERTLTFLGETDPILFKELVERDGGKVEKYLDVLFNTDVTEPHCMEGRAIYFYKTYHDKIVEEEIVVAEEVVVAEPVKTITPPPERNERGKGKKKLKKAIKEKQKEEEIKTEDEEQEEEHEEPIEPIEPTEEETNVGDNEGEQDDTVEEPAQEKGRKKTKKKKTEPKGKTQKDKKSPRTAVETPPVADSELQIVYVTKMVEKVVKAPELHAHIQQLTGECTPNNGQLVYFVRQRLLSIPMPDNFPDACSIMPTHFLLGSIQGNYIAKVSALLKNVFSPVIEKQFREPNTVLSKYQNAEKLIKKSEVMESTDVSVFAEFMPPSEYRRFSLYVMEKQQDPEKTAGVCGRTSKDNNQTKLTPIKHEIMQELSHLIKTIDLSLGSTIESETLQVPDIEIENISSEEQEDAITILKDAVISWGRYIRDILASNAVKVPSGEGPLAVIELWQEKAGTVSALMDQVCQPRIEKIVDMVGKKEPNVSFGFKARVKELNEALAQVKECLKFLSTITRHLKVLTYSESFKEISSTLHPLVQVLRLIWVLSQQFNTDEAMVTFMRRISWVLRQKVSTSLKSETLFKEPLPQVISRTYEAKEMLKSWKKYYLQTRADIEDTGIEKRWEFDQKKLFSDTEYMSSVCADLHDIAVVLQQFFNVIGHELRNNLKDPAQMDTIVKRVENLVVGIEMTDFDIYKSSCRDNWQAVVDAFYKDVQLLEKEVRIFVDQAFLMLRSSEDGLEMLLKLKDADTRPTIRTQLLTKFEVIMQEFIKEIDIKQDLFNRNKRKPPILRYQPPESGAIFWERLLFLTLKRPVLRFQQVSELIDSPLRKVAFSQYNVLAKEMKAYEDGKYEKWCTGVLPFSLQALQRAVLKQDKSKAKGKLSSFRKLSRFSGRSGATASSSNQSQGPISIRFKTRSTTPSSTSKQRPISSTASKQASNINSAPLERDENPTLWQAGIRYLVDFDNQIFDVIAETELMEYLGFTVPSSVRNLALQKDRLHRDLTAVNLVINEYEETLTRMTAEQHQFTYVLIKNVEKHIDPGYSRLNWNSLGIQTYAKNASGALKSLIAAVKQTKRIEAELDKQVKSLMFNFFTTGVSDDAERRMECKEYFSKVEETRADTMAKMSKISAGIGPVLMKLESLVHHTNTGMCSAMTLFYFHWENRILQALLGTAKKNLQDFKSALMGASNLFEISVSLSAPDIILSPDPTQVFNLIMSSVRGCLLQFRAFPRWKNGSCIPAGDYTEDNYYLSSFYDDIIHDREISKLTLDIQTAALQLIADCQRKLVMWKRYSQLWKTDITTKCDSFAAKTPTLSQYDEKFSIYSAVASELEEMTPFEDYLSIRLNLKPIIANVIDLCSQWKHALGSRLAHATHENMVKFQEEIEILTKALNNPIHSLDNFKQVLQTIVQIQKSTISSEIKYEEFQEVYHVLALHHIEVDPQDRLLSESVKKQWQDVYVSSLYRSQALQPTKERFAQMSQIDIQQFVAELESFGVRYKDEGPESVGNDLDRGLTLMEHYSEEFEKLEKKREELLVVEALFDLPGADYSLFIKLRSDFATVQCLFDIYKRLQTYKGNWGKQLWVAVKPEMLLEGLEDITRDFRKLDKGIKQTTIGLATGDKLNEFKVSVPLMIELKSDSLLERHWLMLMEKTGVSYDLSTDKFVLDNIFDMELYRYPGIAEEIIGSAEKEMAIEVAIKEITAVWQKTQFEILPHVFGGEPRGFIIHGIDEIIQTIEENSMTLQGMSASQFIAPFLKTVERLEKNLSLFSDIIDEWMEVQRKWLYLEGIFIGGDIRTQLPEEARKFDDVDKIFRRIMTDVSKRPNVKECCEAQGRLSEFQGLSISLDNCEKSLADYLQSKRNAFPRFYFLSDDELLSILGTTDLAEIQQHIIKIFDNVGALQIDAKVTDVNAVTGLVSSENELMHFIHEVSTEEKLEVWLQKVIQGMRTTNRYFTKKSVFDYGKRRGRRTEWLKEYLGMVGLAANQVWWTAEVENTLKKISEGEQNAMKNYLAQLNQQLNELVICVQGNLSSIDRKKLNTVLLIDVHNRDIIEGFVNNNTVDAHEFEWESQLRYYWMKESDNLVIQQCTGSFPYGYEYLGLSGRLVITPLTDRIYLTFTQALSMYLGGAPAGPAGTGKTETTKDLAKALGLFCLVTNCGEGMDYKSVGKILNGLCQCGAWGCFDEFNRIDISVLSVISSQLHSIRHALVLKLSRFNLDGQEVILNAKVGVFITMNPGYAGRTELPESIKALFRPVVCVAPDLEMICLIMLFSEGFLKANILAKKMTVLYKLSKEQLSKQSHYDFGLRAIKSVLVMAGELKRSSEHLDEEVVLMRTLRDMNLPKFIQEDVPLFLGLINDLFPGLTCAPAEHPQFIEAVESAIQDSSYETVPYQIEKVVQLYETNMTRHSTMVVGPTGGGKSVIIEILQQAQTLLGKPNIMKTINPKACTLKQLYGVLDLTTRDWTDGLLSSIFRDLNKATETSERRYILFDGDVDALWIENMNSVMDDNKLLTLPNGERIRLKPYCSLLFEVGNLNHASPATVSRAGMIYVDSTKMDFSCYWRKWLHKFDNDPERQHILTKLYDKYIHAVSEFVLEGRMGVQQIEIPRKIIPQTGLNMTIQFCSVMDETLPRAKQYGKEEKNEETSLKLSYLVEAIFIQAIYLSFGATILLEEREKFDEFVKKTSSLLQVNDNLDKKSSVKNLPLSAKTLFEYYVDVENNCWSSWNWVIPKYNHNRTLSFSDILVPTIDTLRADWFMQLQNNANRPLVLVGETGASKTAVILEYLRKLPTKLVHHIKLNFSSQTTAQIVQYNLQSTVEKRTKHIFGPPLGSKLIVFIDDLNMPQVDQYGTQQTTAFLKLLFEKSGFYELEKEQIWINLSDTYFISAMGKSGGGRADLDPRFISKLSVYNMTLPGDDVSLYIFSSILSGHAEILHPTIQAAVPKIVKVSFKLLKEISQELPPTPSRFHYIFNLRDLSRITGGVCQIQPNYFKTVDTFVRVWRNEFTRVICDRLITHEEQSLVSTKLRNEIQEHFPESADIALRDPLLFGDFRNACREDEPRWYEDLLDYEAVNFLIHEILEEYQERHTNLKIVLFNHATEHITRIHRVLRMAKGHMMIVGVGGSGKKSLTKLAAFAAGCSVFEIFLKRSYHLNHLIEDIKRMYRQVGLNGTKTVFLFSASQILEESFLDIISNILAIGVATNLFSTEEKDDIINALREDAEKEGYTSSKESVWSYFCNRCNENLHVVLTMSPLGEDLRRRCRDFPGLVSYTTINWFFEWPQEALESVAQVFLAQNPEVPEEYRSTIVKHVVHVHSSMQTYSIEYLLKYRRKNYVTPKQYLYFLEHYIKLLTEKNQLMKDQTERLGCGIEKIAEARIQLNELNQRLAAQEIAVKSKTSACTDLLETIRNATEAANSKKTAATKKKREMEDQKKIMNLEKIEAEEILEKALPILDAAKNSLNDLDKADITEIRSFTTPPQAVQTVSECVLYLLGVKEISWKSAKAVMADPYFILRLRELNCDQIPLTQQRLCKAHSKNLPPDLRATSSAAHGLMMFVHAVLGYCHVYREVKPKKDKVQQLEEELINSQLFLENLTKEIMMIEKQLKELGEQYEHAMQEQGQLEDVANLMMKRSIAADKLMTGLTSEKIRWTETLEKYQSSQHMLIGDCLHSSAFLSYTGPFNYEMRCNMIYENWLSNMLDLGIPVTSTFRIETALSDEVEISKWNSEGLPSDEYSIQNAILSVQGSRFPICIDPQRQALHWISKKEEKSLKTTSFSDPDYMKHLEGAIKYGFPILFEDVEDYVDPLIENILEKKYEKKGGRYFIRLGEKELDVDSKFRLYLISKCANPNINPALYAKALVINFTVTAIGLENQLVGVIVRNEVPEAEEKRETLINEVFKKRALLQYLEDSLLQELNNATGNMLDNEILIKVLEESKTNASKVSQQLSESQETAKEIDDLRNKYRPVAAKGSILYFVLSDMAIVNPMYQYSLNSYLDVFTLSLKRAEAETFIANRIKNMINALTVNVYEFGCLGTFEKHKLLFAFEMAVKLEQAAGKLTQKDLEFFIKGKVLIERPSVLCPHPWMSPSHWENIYSLSVQHTNNFQNLLEDIAMNTSEWQTWINSESPELMQLPTDYFSSFSYFQKMMILRCFRPERVYRSITRFITLTIGASFTISPTVTMKKIFENSTPLMPVIFILSPGADPVSEVMQLAEVCGMSGGKCKYVSLGQGQENLALSLLQVTIQQGQWLVLLNCHLLTPFIKKIEQVLEKLTKPHPDFRLWCTTDPTNTFPVSMLQRSIKVVTEPPNGLKLNLKTTFMRMPSDTLDTCQHPFFKPITFVVAYFHAIVQERRKYGKIGWNIPYDFSETDFNVSVEIVKLYLNTCHDRQDTKIPWKSMKYLIGEVMYGGRVIDDYDRRIVQTYIDEYMGDFIFDGFQPFHFYQTGDTNYVIPPIESLNQILGYVDSLPDEDQSAVFGLHANAEIGYFTNSTKELWMNLIEMQPATDLGGRASSEELVDKICIDILSKMPPLFEISKIRKHFEMTLTPTTIVLLQELEIFNHLIRHMNQTLNQLRKAIAGESEMDTFLDETSKSLFNGQLPPSWRQIIPPTLKNLPAWMEQFDRRSQQYSNWALRGEPPVTWLSGLHVPTAFLTALMQMACRANGWALDRAELSVTVSKYENSDDVEIGLLQGSYIEGVFIEGARWGMKEQCLLPSRPKILLEEMPVMQVIPIQRHRIKEEKLLPTPVYTTSLRRNAMGFGLVFEADLTTREHPSHWILQGVCLLLNSD